MAETISKNVLIGIAFISLFVVLSVLISGCTKPAANKNVTEQDAISFVLDDLKAKYPDAEVREVVEISKSDDSWYVKAKVTYNYSSPCPVRMHLYYDYPKKGFIISSPEYVTKDCTVCTAGTCVIGTPEEAIIASHTLTGTETAADYLSFHSDAKPDAKFYAEYVLDNTKNQNVWIVKWFSPSTNYGVYVMITNEGQILRTWEVAKTEMPA
jgi:archaellum component FlaF (FlaF/FlaG flagellin family)